MEDEYELFQALRHLKHNKHEVILFHTVDKDKEVNFNFPDRPYEFIDLETGESIKVQSSQVKEEYQRQMSSYIRHLREKMPAGIDRFCRSRHQTGIPARVLLPYLVKRTKKWPDDMAIRTGKSVPCLPDEVQQDDIEKQTKNW